MKLNHSSPIRRVLATALTALIGAALLTAGPLQAQDAPAGPPPGKEPGKKMEHRGDRWKERLDQMKTSLALTDEQVAKITAIREEQAASMKTIMDDASLSKEERREKMKPLRDATDEKITAVLTAEQNAKWQEEKKNRKQKGEPK
jgi:Spy/CpxP family protein refolding chaperone